MTLVILQMRLLVPASTVKKFVNHSTHVEVMSHEKPTPSIRVSSVSWKPSL